jgi:hypothetical protein
MVCVRIEHTRRRKETYAIRSIAVGFKSDYGMENITFL